MSAKSKKKSSKPVDNSSVETFRWPKEEKELQEKTHAWLKENERSIGFLVIKQLKKFFEDK